MAGDAEDGDGERVRLFIGQVPCSMAEEEILAVDRVAARANDATVIRYCAAVRVHVPKVPPKVRMTTWTAPPLPRSLEGGHRIVHGDG
ncbi:Os10g0368700 [Oryza sativa Japonica Group]|uniref:Os10g0368700 protein n=2 Tax=Oryza sativa subsp. japonica TaxID=39947 RepID=Q109S8_ORYSJ|nr:hypothetical protein LOC_Os10g22356 [Oryza sativa Japonica Group]EEE50837.1 hypothetical protein OsJ_31257 [Oryza sativa Japonica Group]KAF2913286.1 hypothetical protein DAI22_10g073300 [Oryza sativa Japonica Group]BAT10545.1 Os10g0368700 [Oryza sativa Japonica Group]